MVRRRGNYIGGRDALAEFDRGISSLRRTLSDALEEIDTAESRQAELRQEQAEAYQQLAKIRLDVVAAGLSIDDLQGAESQARELLESHDEYAARQQERVDQSSALITDLEAARREAAAALDESVEAYEVRVAEIEEALEKDDAYLALAEELEEASAIVARSEQKLELAKDDRNRKGVPYDDDPLFSYLWQRGFRTTDYKGRGLTKMLDNWVARLIKFDRARLNYARLTELPKRLAEHVEQVKSEQTEAQSNLEAAEQTALQNGGAVELEAAANTRRSELEAVDVKIEQAEDAHRSAIAAHEEILRGGKGPAAEARAVLEAALKQASFPDLRLLAAETIELHDDRIVDQLVKLRAEQMSLELDERDLHERPAVIKDDLRLLENLRSEFKRARYDSPYASFKVSVIDRVLKGMGKGQLDPRQAMRVLRKGMVQRQPRTPRGFGGRRRNDTLGLPDVFEDVLGEVIRQSSKGGWGGSGRARPIKRRSPKIKPRSKSPRRSSDKKGSGFKTTGGF